MPKITKENIDALDEKVIVTLEPLDYTKDYEKNLKEYSKRAELKGFPKGKVPKPLVQKMYGSSLLADQLMRQAYNEANTYVRDNEIDIFAQPMLVDMPEIKKELELDKEYTFGFEIGLRPSFDVPLLDGKHKDEILHVEATDEMVEDDIERLRNRMGEMTNPETVEDENTVLNVTMQLVDEDGKAIEGKEPIENSFLLSYLDEPKRPDFMGKKVGDSVTVKFTDAFSDKLTKPMATDLGLDAENPDDLESHIMITIDKIGYVEKAALDTDFFEKVLPGRDIKDETEFRKQIKEDIQRQWDEASINVVDNSLYERLVHETEIDFPDDFLRKWLQYKDEQPLTEEEVQVAYPNFIHQLKWTVISDKIIKDYDIKVEEEEVRQAIAEQVRGYFGMTAGMEEAWMDDFINKSIQDPEQYQKTANDIMAKKVMAVVREKIKLDSVTVTPDEFKQKSEELSHKYHNH